LFRFQTKVACLIQELGRKPSVEEISKSLEMEEEAVRDMLKGLPTEVSLEMRIGEEDEKRLEDVLQDMSITPLDQVLIRQALEEELNTC
jgi:RNA polymerase primary sigma factor